MKILLKEPTNFSDHSLNNLLEAFDTNITSTLEEIFKIKEFSEEEINSFLKKIENKIFSESQVQKIFEIYLRMIKIKEIIFSKREIKFDKTILKLANIYDFPECKAINILAYLIKSMYRSNFKDKLLHKSNLSDRKILDFKNPDKSIIEQDKNGLNFTNFDKSLQKSTLESENLNERKEIIFITIDLLFREYDSDLYNFALHFDQNSEFTLTEEINSQKIFLEKIKFLSNFEILKNIIKKTKSYEIINLRIEFLKKNLKTDFVDFLTEIYENFNICANSNNKCANSNINTNICANFNNICVNNNNIYENTNINNIFENLTYLEKILFKLKNTELVNFIRKTNFTNKKISQKFFTECHSIDCYYSEAFLTTIKDLEFMNNLDLQNLIQSRYFKHVSYSYENFTKIFDELINRKIEFSFDQFFILKNSKKLDFYEFQKSTSLRKKYNQIDKLKYVYLQCEKMKYLKNFLEFKKSSEKFFKKILKVNIANMNRNIANVEENIANMNRNMNEKNPFIQKCIYKESIKKDENFSKSNISKNLTKNFSKNFSNNLTNNLTENNMSNLVDIFILSQNPKFISLIFKICKKFLISKLKNLPFSHFQMKCMKYLVKKEIKVFDFKCIKETSEFARIAKLKIFCKNVEEKILYKLKNIQINKNEVNNLKKNLNKNNSEVNNLNKNNYEVNNLTKNNYELKSDKFESEKTEDFLKILKKKLSDDKCDNKINDVCDDKCNTKSIDKCNTKSIDTGNKNICNHSQKGIYFNNSSITIKNESKKFTLSFKAKTFSMNNFTLLKFDNYEINSQNVLFSDQFSVICKYKNNDLKIFINGVIFEQKMKISEIKICKGMIGIVNSVLFYESYENIPKNTFFGDQNDQNNTFFSYQNDQNDQNYQNYQNNQNNQNYQNNQTNTFNNQNNTFNNQNNTFNNQNNTFFNLNFISENRRINFQTEIVPLQKLLLWKQRSGVFIHSNIYKLNKKAPKVIFKNIIMN